MFRWAAMSLLWSCAAFVSFAFRASGEHPALARSLLTSSRIRAAVPEAGAAAFDALGDAAGALGAVDVLVAGLALGAVHPGWWACAAFVQWPFSQWPCRWWPYPRYSWCCCPFRHAMAAEGTATAPIASAATVIFR